MSQPWHHTSAVRIAVLVLLFGLLPFVEAAHQPSLSSLAAGDFWWHVRVGLGILQNHAMPHSGLYSQLAVSPWIATSWLYDLKAGLYFRWFGWVALPIFAIGCKLLLAIVTFLLARGLTGRFWPAVALSACAQFILIGLPPLPLYASVLFFAVELILLFEARRSGNLRLLYGLPIVFLLWANIDVNFVIGTFVLLLYVAAWLLEPRITNSATDDPTPHELKALGAVTAASFFATVLTPYGWQPYGVFFARLTSAANEYFAEFHSLGFRGPQDYLLLLLVAAAFLALGIRRSRHPFAIALLLLAAFASFRSQHDAWLATLAAVAVLADALPSCEVDGAAAPAPAPLPPLRFLVAAGIALVLLTAAAVIHFPRSREAALARIGQAYPVAAADYMRQQHLPAPLFNALPWGGFLTVYLPEYPVAIDGRSELYGDDTNIQYAKVMNADAHFATLPALNQAGTLLLEKNSLMGKALPNVRGFQVAYSDNVAVVLVREPAAP